jgi:hypothetical protein
MERGRVEGDGGAEAQLSASHYCMLYPLSTELRILLVLGFLEFPGRCPVALHNILKAALWLA